MARLFLSNVKYEKIQLGYKTQFDVMMMFMPSSYGSQFPLDVCSHLSLIG